jgi:CRP/FNR family transcriptional regulator, dissimilatory nitrate respiration regulator
MAAKKALQASGKFIPWQVVTISVDGKILHTGSKSIRGRLMSCFSECARSSGSNSFLLPYNRQQLADYLNVDRSTMSNELSKMQKDGLLTYKKNHILLKI